MAAWILGRLIARDLALRKRLPRVSRRPRLDQNARLAIELFFPAAKNGGSAIAPFWLRAFADVYVPLSVLTAAFVAGDVFVAGRRQAMPIMDAVWPLTMRYWGPLGLPFHFAFGRAPPAGRRRGHAERPMWQAAFVAATH